MNANEVWTWFLFENILNSSNERRPRKKCEASNATEAPLQLLHQAQQEWWASPFWTTRTVSFQLRVMNCSGTDLIWLFLSESFQLLILVLTILPLTCLKKCCTTQSLVYRYFMIFYVRMYDIPSREHILYISQAFNGARKMIDSTWAFHMTGVQLGGAYLPSYRAWGGCWVVWMMGWVRCVCHLMGQNGGYFYYMANKNGWMLTVFFVI